MSHDLQSTIENLRDMQFKPDTPPKKIKEADLLVKIVHRFGGYSAFFGVKCENGSIAGLGYYQILQTPPKDKDKLFIRYAPHTYSYGGYHEVSHPTWDSPDGYKPYKKLPIRYRRNEAEIKDFWINNYPKIREFILSYRTPYINTQLPFFDEIYGILEIEGLTPDEQRDVKEAASVLLYRAYAVPKTPDDKFFITDWHMDIHGKLFVEKNITKILDEYLPKCYTKSIFGEKSTQVYQFFLANRAEFARQALGAIPQDIGFTITKSTHTKTGEDIWLIKFDRLKERDDFKELERRMKPLAYYSSFPSVRAFVAKSEVTEADVRAVLAGKGQTSPTPSPKTKTKTIEKKIDFNADRIRRDVVRREIEAGKMLVAEYRYWDFYTDIHKYHTLENMTWGQPQENDFFMRAALRTYRLTPKRGRYIEVGDDYWLVYADELEDFKRLRKEIAEKAEKERAFENLIRSRFRSLEEYKSIVNSFHKYLINWTDLFTTHKSLLRLAYDDEYNRFLDVVQESGTKAKLVSFMYQNAEEATALRDAIKADMLSDTSNQLPLEQVLARVRAYDDYLLSNKTPRSRPTELEKVTELLRSIDFGALLGKVDDAPLFPNYKGGKLTITV